MFRIESFLSARLFVNPQIIGKHIYFISNLSGHLSLYIMDKGGSVPQPLLPPELALQNPHLLSGESFYVFPSLGKIVVQVDQDGDENYQPCFIPIEGGYPEPIFPQLSDFKSYLLHCDNLHNLAYLFTQSNTEQNIISYRADLKDGTLTKLYESMYGASFDGCNTNHSKVILNEFYTIGDSALYLWDKDKNQTELIFGTPLEDRQPNQDVPINGIQACHFVRDDQYLVFSTTLFDDTGGLGYIELSQPAKAKPLPIKGVIHKGMGEFGVLKHLHSDQYLATYNIDGCDWVYQGSLDEDGLEFNLEKVLIGQGQLANGVLDHLDYEKESGIFALSFSTATSPTQIHTIENGEIRQHTRERILGIPEGILSIGEDASFTSFDGLRVSARLYLPSDTLGFNPPYPLIYYIHGGPQSQERPDFSWFSMPLIQFLTMQGFAVFVPNVRGSSGYGMSYMKKVDRDWGGDDLLDHVHAMTQVLPKDTRIDTQRAAVVGRSYGGYMTLMLAGRYPELWRASCDMFGPYDLITFSERIPETWKPYFKMALADPDTPEGRQFLTERSPHTYIESLGAPMLVVQGKNDPRVVEQESRDLVEHLRSIGKEVEYLMFENEGHDVLKFENRVTVYNAITDFFKKHLSN